VAECYLRACAEGPRPSPKECEESTAEVIDSKCLAAIPNALIRVLEGELVCALDEALHASLTSIEDPEGLCQSLASKMTKAVE
jgi:hypothetical protein